MAWKDYAVLTAIGGASLGVAFGGTYVAALLTNDAGDVLGFFGAAAGAGLAVLGAVFVENWKAKRVSRDDLETLGGMLEQIASMALIIKESRSQDKWGALLALEQTLTAFSAVRPGLALRSPDLISRVATLEYWAAKWRETSEGIRTDLNGYPPSTTEIEKTADALADTVLKTVGAVASGGVEWPVATRAAMASLAQLWEAHKATG